MASRPSAEDAQEAAVLVTMPHADVAGIVPSLPLETRWPPFLLRLYAGFWLPEEALKAGFPALHSVFVPRPTDVFLASFPKSGTTWLKALAFATLKRSAHPPLDGGDHPLRHCSPHDCVGFLEIELNAVGAGCRIVYICRDPKDALVSYWLFTETFAKAFGVDAESFTIQEAFELFCEGRCPGGPQWQHVRRYWEESVRTLDRVLFLRYEEMLLEPESHLKMLAKFMGCEFSDEEEERGVVSAIVELCSLGKMKDMEVNRNGRTNNLGVKNESYLRKGVAGDWSNHMTPEMAQRLDKIVEDALEGSGFTFASSASATPSSSC